MPSLTPELSQKTKKNYVFEQIFKLSFKFEPLPPLISELNSKFDYVPYVLLIEVLSEGVEKKSFGGRLDPPPPLDQEGLIIVGLVETLRRTC